MSRSDLVDLEMIVHAKTAKAVLASDDGEKDNAIWLPLSLVEVEFTRDGIATKQATITMPEWLAKKEGLI